MNVPDRTTSTGVTTKRFPLLQSFLARFIMNSVMVSGWWLLVDKSGCEKWVCKIARRHGCTYEAVTIPRATGNCWSSGDPAATQSGRFILRRWSWSELCHIWYSLDTGDYHLSLEGLGSTYWQWSASRRLRSQLRRKVNHPPTPAPAPRHYQGIITRTHRVVSDICWTCYWRWIDIGETSRS